MATSTVENYLKHILLLSEGGDDLIPMGALADALLVVPGTVTTMVKSLADSGFVEHLRLMFCANIGWWKRFSSTS
jgi:DtxR family Mn-dependent transcriptional regulator